MTLRFTCSSSTERRDVWRRTVSATHVSQANDGSSTPVDGLAAIACRRSL
jgi:hypothetical protein